MRLIALNPYERIGAMLGKVGLCSIVLATAMMISAATAAADNPIVLQPGDLPTQCRNFLVTKTGHGFIFGFEVTLKIRLKTHGCYNGFTVSNAYQECKILDQSTLSVNVTCTSSGGYNDAHTGYHAEAKFYIEECIIPLKLGCFWHNTVTFEMDIDYLGHHHLNVIGA